MSKRREPLSPERSLKRRGPRFEARSRFLLVCEGEVTEFKYFEYVRNELQDRLIAIQVASNRGDPLDIVDEAIARRSEANGRAKKAKDDNLRFDQVWCVLDVDTHTRLPVAERRAVKEGIQLAISNPCFELWALLHFQAYGSEADGKTVRDSLRKHMSDYDKELDHRKMRGRYKDARERAIAMEKNHERIGNPCGANPSTSVWRLVDELIKVRTKPGPGVRPRPCEI